MAIENVYNVYRKFPPTLVATEEEKHPRKSRRRGFIRELAMNINYFLRENFSFCEKKLNKNPAPGKAAAGVV